MMSSGKKTVYRVVPFTFAPSEVLFVEEEENEVIWDLVACALG